MVRSGFILLVAVLVLGCSGEEKEPSIKWRVASITTIDDDIGRVDWSYVRNRLAVDKMGADGYFDIWLMDPDGSNAVCLTHGVAGLPDKHVGNPAWHPDGEWIVFQAEKQNHLGPSDLSTPGIGLHNELWVIRYDGSEFYQLTTVPAGCSTLHPHFSHDGTKLVWGETVSGPDDWVIKVADFVVDASGAHLENIQTLTPGNPSSPVWYETHGFSPDDKKIIFTANLESGQPWTGADIYTYDLTTGQLQRLTHSFSDWDEHGHFSPDGRYIIWMSSTGFAFSGVGDLSTEFWIMSADGSQKKRLTFFNDPNHPHYTGHRTVAGDFAWSPDGTAIIGRLILDGDNNHARLVRIDLTK